MPRVQAMQIGAVLPHNEIGNDPGAITAYLQGVEELIETAAQASFLIAFTGHAWHALGEVEVVAGAPSWPQRAAAPPTPSPPR